MTYDPWNPATYRLAALVGESDYRPLRAPAPRDDDWPVDVAPVGDADAGPLERCAITPGMRCIDGTWYYSARWL